MKLPRWVGLALCRRGHHEPLEWYSARDRFPVATNSAQEMMYAAGLHQLAQWNGWCPRCSHAVEWSSVKPRHLHGKVAR